LPRHTKRLTLIREVGSKPNKSEATEIKSGRQPINNNMMVNKDQKQHFDQGRQAQ
jgi:hypothetical protein